MVGGHGFQFSGANGVILNLFDCRHICHNRTVAEITGFRIFFNSHIRHFANRDVIGFSHKLLFLIIGNRFSEQGFCFRLAFCSYKLFLYFSSTVKSAACRYKGIFQRQRTKSVGGKIKETEAEIAGRLDKIPNTLKEDGYPDVQVLMRTFREMESVVEQSNRDLAE